MAQNVTTFTESDFSRTFQPTTADGSDHAWGSHHLVLGGAVQGGQIFGAVPDVRARRAERHRHTRPLDSDDLDRPVRRDAVLLVRNSRQRAGRRVPQSGELPHVESRVPGVTTKSLGPVNRFLWSRL